MQRMGIHVIYVLTPFDVLQMKGMPKNKVPLEVTRMVSSLGLQAKRHAQSQTLSGGMKRKLSVGIALCAGSKVVLCTTIILNDRQ